MTLKHQCQLNFNSLTSAPSTTSVIYGATDRMTRHMFDQSAYASNNPKSRGPHLNRPMSVKESRLRQTSSDANMEATIRTNMLIPHLLLDRSPRLESDRAPNDEFHIAIQRMQSLTTKASFAHKQLPVDQVIEEDEECLKLIITS